MAPRPRAVLLLVAGLILTILAYLPALEAGFYFDDLPNIVEAPGLRWTSVSAAAVEGLWKETLIPRRPVANLSFALNYLAGGLDPWGYHLLNLLLHLAAGAALVWVAQTLDRERQGGSARDLSPAVVAAVLWLVHPLGTQSVTYTVQRMTVLATLFSLMAFGAYLQGRRVRRWHAGAWYLLAVLLWLLAVGSKETALALPLVVLTYELCLRPGAWRQGIARLWGNRRKRALALQVLVVAIVGITLVADAYLGESSLSLTQRFPNRDFSGLERVLTQARVQWLYLGLLVWPAPSRLNLDHDIAVSRGLLEPPTTLPALLLWLGVAAGAGMLAARRPAYGFALLAYLELHLLEAGPLNLELAFEHRMYLPMAFLALLPAAALADLPAPRRRWVVALAMLLALPLAGATWERNRVWADPIAFHQDCAAKAPGKFRPWYNLGTVLGQAGRAAEALPVLERAVALDPQHSEARNQLGNAYLLTGRPRQALEQYRRAVALKPDNAEAVFNLARLLDDRGSTGEAVAAYLRFLALAPPWLAPQAEQVRQRLRALGVGLREAP